MALVTFLKDPDALLDYTIDWTTWLDGDTIDTSNWTLPSGITEDSSGMDGTSSKATVWLSGGDAGTVYTVVNTIVTAAGRTDERSLDIKVAER